MKQPRLSMPIRKPKRRTHQQKSDAYLAFARDTVAAKGQAGTPNPANPRKPS